MRARWATLCVGIVVVIIAGGCGRPATVNDLLYMQTPRGITLIRAGGSAPVFRDAEGVPSGNWNTVVHAQQLGGATTVSASVPATNARLWQDTVPGGWRTKVVSEDGNLAALGPAREAYYTDGRRNTYLAIAGNTVRTRRITLRGNFEPEAFSTDGTSLFVLQYRPARNPTTYQVRRLDLNTARVHDVFTPDAHLQEAMRGTARVQASSGDGRRLYTLYTVGSGADRHAFIHALALDELWAHCIDLPHEFALAAESAGLTMSPDGDRLYVVNAVSNAIAEIDTSTLEVVRTRTVDLVARDQVHALAGENGRIYVADGPFVSAIDKSSLRVIDEWVLPERVKGLQLSKDLLKLYVGLRDRIVVLDADSGARVRTLDPRGVGRIGSLGKVRPTPVPLYDKIVCAC